MADPLRPACSVFLNEVKDLPLIMADNELAAIHLGHWGGGIALIARKIAHDETFYSEYYYICGLQHVFVLKQSRIIRALRRPNVRDLDARKHEDNRH